MNLTRRQAPTLILVAACGLVMVTATLASAHPDPFPERLADNSTHGFCSSESDPQDRAKFETQFGNSMDHLEGATQMTTQPAPCSSTVDVYWYVAPAGSFDNPDAIATERCVDPVAGSAARCERAAIAFNEAFMSDTGLERRHTACHEISHTLGTNDSLMLANGCFPQTRYSDGITHTTHEVDHINDFY